MPNADGATWNVDAVPEMVVYDADGTEVLRWFYGRWVGNYANRAELARRADPSPSHAVLEVAMPTTIAITRPTAVMRHYAGADRARDPVYLEIDPTAPLGLSRGSRLDSQRLSEGGRGAWKGTVGELLAKHGIQRSDDAVEQLSYGDIAVLTGAHHVGVILE